MSLYDILKAAKIGAASDVFTTLRAQQAPFAKGGSSTPTEKELTGVPPLTFSAIGEPLIEWSIDGNMSQTGTPTSASPIFPSECGELVESGTHSGEYAIPVVCGGSTNNIYLSEPIRKLGTYTDTAASTDTASRVIGKYEFTGNENWNIHGSIASWFYVDNAFTPTLPTTTQENIDMITSHYDVRPYSTASGLSNGQCTCGNPAGDTSRFRFIIKDTGYSTVTDFTDWLKAQYQNGTPVTVWYVLATPTTESFTAPTIPTSNGSNTLNVNTTLAPSNVYIKYKG